MDLRVCRRCDQVHGSGTTCPGCGSPLALADTSFFLGRDFGKYRVERVLGAGGMGVVFAARHLTLNRPAALKLVQPAVADEAFLKRFLREAQVLADLKHPNIVEVYDFDVSPWGPPYYVMEYLEGRTLREVIERRGPQLALADYAPLLRDLEGALSFAHAKGVVHRDLKPENIFVATFADRTVGKVLDFGIAKLLSEGASDTHLTASGAVMGTPNYLAPEQILIQPLGPATDQYALALVVAEMVTGRAVRAGKSLGEICSVEIRKPLPLQWPERPELPSAVGAALHRATQPDPAARFFDVRAFVEALGLPPPGTATGPLAEAVRAAGGDLTTALTPSGGRPASGAALPETACVPATPPPRTYRGTPPPTLAAKAAPPAVPGRRWVKGLLWGGAAAALLVVAGALIPFLLPGVAERPAPKAPAAQTERPLEVAWTLPLPADAKALLGRKVDDGVTLAAGPDCVYLLKAGAPATRVPLDPGQALVGASPEGDLWIRQGEVLLSKNFVAGESQEWARPLPEAEGMALSPSGSFLAAFRAGSVQVYALGGGAPRPLAPPWPLSGPPVRWALGERALAVLTERDLSAFDLAGGGPLWTQPLPDYGATALALEEVRGLVAVGGRFDKVHFFELFAGGRRTQVARQGETRGLCFLPDGPTLAVAGEGGLKLWREGGEGFFAEVGAPEETLGSVRWCGPYLLAEEVRGGSVRAFAVRGAAGHRALPVAKKELWALCADPAGGRLYAGSSDGLLSALEVATGAVTAHPLHTQGLTALAAGGGHLASSSDDKTIAIWQTSTMAVVWRSKAHDYLINGLSLAGEPPSLWSASSDGKVKRWAWPQLEELEELDTRALLGRGYTLAALWAAPAGDRVLAGTWNGALLVFDRGGGGRWTGRALPVESQCLYSAAPLKAVDAVLFGGLGGRRPGVYLFDLRRGELHRLEDLGVPLYNAFVAASPAGDEACAAGAGAVLHLAFQRGPDGALRYGARAALHSDLGACVSAAWVPGADLLATGDPAGAVHLLPLRSLRGAPRLEVPLGPGK